LVVVDAAGRVRQTVGVTDGLPGAQVSAVAWSDAGHALWVGTEGGLVELREDAAALAEGGTHRPPSRGDARPRWVVSRVVPTGPVTALVAVAGWVYVGVRDRGVVRVDRVSLRVDPIPFARPARGLAATGRARVTALDSDGECDGGGLLVGTAGGGVYRQVDEVLVRDSGFPATTWAWSVHSAPGVATVAAVAGLLRGGGPGPLSRRDLRVLARDARGRLVVAGEGGRLWRVDGEGRLVSAGAVPGAVGDVVSALGLGPDGACAVGAHGAWVRPSGGAWRLVRGVAAPPADLSAVAVARDGAVWVAGFRGGLWRWAASPTGADGGWRRVAAGRVEPWVNALAVARDGAVWAATARGLFRVSRDGRVRRFGVQDGLPSENLHTVLALRSGGVAVGGTGGLARVEGGRVRLVGVKQGLQVRGVWALAERPEAAGGGLVVGTTEGVWWEPRPGRWTRLSVASGHLRDDFVTALALSRDGRTLWVGTYQGGVARVDLGAGSPVAAQLGGGRVNVGGLVLAPGPGEAQGLTLLAATMEGLLRRPAGGDGPWARVPGPPGLDVTGVAPAGGALWVATRRGVARLATWAGGDATGR